MRSVIGDATEDDSIQNETIQSVKDGQQDKECEIDRNKNKKRKIDDVYSRINNGSSSKAGRGSIAGWTQCPYCGGAKVFALGRGIATHLHTVHTPWKPSKKEIKRRERIRQRLQRQYSSQDYPSQVISQLGTQYWNIYQKSLQQKESQTQPELNQSNNNNNKQTDNFLEMYHYTPTDQEIQDWNTKVQEIMEKLERTPKRQRINKNMDRDGNPSCSYQDSLPPIMKAARDGNLSQLKELITETNSNLLELKDRNGSTAEHWAAGSGHLHCLKYILLQQQKQQSCNKQKNDQPTKFNVRKRRDGKTSLHYAARNGHNSCINFLCQEYFSSNIDITSGDGTTPLHMACYGGHLSTIQLLIDTFKVDVYHRNDWGCTVFHWIAMTIQTNKEEVTKIINYLLSKTSLEFCCSTTNKKGHTALHKAAQKCNSHIIKSFYTLFEKKETKLLQLQQSFAKPDNGNHIPSDIWISIGGNPQFAAWMKTTCQW